nr:putative reverse transcriptase domain-containing protein [Tanacetum cinerariifolium]
MVILNEAHTSRYSVHPGTDKMYHVQRDMYWWLGMKRDIAIYEALGTRLNLSTAYHPQMDRQTKFFYNNSYHSSIRCASFEALYGRKCRSPVLWAEIGKDSLIGPKLVLETTYKVVLIKEKRKV